jgi:hypothetical protein
MSIQVYPTTHCMLFGEDWVALYTGLIQMNTKKIIVAIILLQIRKMSQ